MLGSSLVCENRTSTNLSRPIDDNENEKQKCFITRDDVSWRMTDRQSGLADQQPSCAGPFDLPSEIVKTAVGRTPLRFPR